MRASVLAAMLCLAACIPSVDPDKGRYSCATADDCGAGWDCQPQFAGGGRCFKAGTCAAAEVCNGSDDTCDGRVDETFDLTQDGANCGQCGRTCAVGTTCRSSDCRENTCNDGVDNDGDALIDCADDSCFGLECQLTPPPAGLCGAVPPRPDGGLDAGQPDGGADGGLLPGCFRPETVCDDGFDDDGDGLADCRDPDCDGRTCFSGTACLNRLCPGPG